MALATVEELMALRTNNPDAHLGYTDSDTPARGRHMVNEKAAQKYLDYTLKKTLACEHYKGVRPWNIVDITAALDKDQPWLGFEFEMGLKSRTDYEKLINYVWKNIDHVAIDREGFGPYCPEITFSPENLSNYMEGTSAIQRLTNWMAENNIKMDDFGEYPVGTHLNVSTPAYRAANGSKQTLVTALIRNSLVMLTEKDHKNLFGRVAYGIGQEGDGSWIEFKIFRSSDDPEVLAKYVSIGRYMAEVVEAASSLETVPAINFDGHAPYIHNIKALLTGKDKSLDIRRSTGRVVVSGGWRRDRYSANGGLVYSKFRAKEAIKNAA